MLNRHTLLLALNDVEDADLESTRRSLKYHIRETSRRPLRVWRTILIAAIIAEVSTILRSTTVETQPEVPE